MNRNQLNQQLKRLHNDYIRDMKRIDEKSQERERRKFQELNEKFVSDFERIKPPDTSIDNEKNIKNESKTNNMNQENEHNPELYEMWKRWDNLRTFFPQNKMIWIHQFPDWFVECMNEVEKR